MKIDDSIKKTAGLSVGTSTTRPSKGADKTSGATQSSSDNVHISPQLQALEGQLSGAGVFDANKVDQIKAAIADGQFQVNPEKVANGLLDTVNDLLRTRKA